MILGKANLSEFANSGSYSESGYGMVWNAFKPSKTSLGSSGGSAVATALSFAAFGMGTQTGVSLYAPSTGASLVSLRGTDGISSGAGVMPLTWLQDFEGPIARTTSDVARILNVTTGTDPDDIATVHADADAKRPADWKTALDQNALQGKKIGYVPSAFDASPELRPGGRHGRRAEGALRRHRRRRRHDGPGHRDRAGARPAPARSPAAAPRRAGSATSTCTTTRRTTRPRRSCPRRRCSRTTAGPRTRRPRLSAADIDKIFAQRDEYKARWKTYMDTAGVDAIVYPGFRSDVYDNDGAQTLSSDRNSGVPTSNVGLPTLILPVGANPHGDPMSLQFVGRAWDDAKMLGFGYALEQQLGGAGHLAPRPRRACST